MIVTNNNIKEIAENILNKERLIALDFETVSLTDKTMVAFTFAYDSEIYFVPIKMKYFINVKEESYKPLLNIIMTQEVIFHHSAFDLQVLQGVGITYDTSYIHDTLIVSHLWNENGSHKLKDLVKWYLNYNMLKFKDVCGVGKKQISFRDISDKETAYKYATDDATYTLKLFNLLYPKIKADKDLTQAYELERELLLVIDDMHSQGVPINGTKIKSIKKKCKDKVEEYRGKLDYYMSDVNINSSKQLKEYFIDKKGLPILKRSSKTGSPSVDAEVLRKYASSSREAEWILRYREYNKILSTFVPALTPDKYGFIYPHFFQVGTTSGRFSCGEPNFQNIPVHDDLGIRSCIEAPKGKVFVGADYGQMELRFTAHVTQDKNMMDTFNMGKDIHTITSQKVGCTRSRAKVLNFGLLYGMSVKALAKNLNCNREDANKYMHEYRIAYPSLETYMAQMRIKADKEGYLNLYLGRKRRLPATYPTAEEWVKQGILRSMTNATIQGGCAMIVKKAMTLMFKELKLYDAHIIAQIHDEVIVICDEEYAGQVQEIVERCMIQPTLSLTVPFTVDTNIGKNWEMIH